MANRLLTCSRLRQMSRWAESAPVSCYASSTPIGPLVSALSRQQKKEKKTKKKTHGHHLPQHSRCRQFSKSTRPIAREPVVGLENRHLSRIVEDALKPLDTPRAPSEAEVLRSLLTIKELAQSFVQAAKDAAAKEPLLAGDSPATNLLSLEERAQAMDTESRSAAEVPAAIKDQVVETLSTVAHTIVTDPKVFINPKILQSYTTIQILLGRPEALPQAFVLYANKPVPKPDTSPVRYTPARPNRVASAVPISVAESALDAAIYARDLPLCFDVISTTVCTPAFHRYKFVQRALVPLSGLALAPLAAYTLASKLSAVQVAMDAQTATNTAFAGIVAYVGFTAVIGLVALTTANDHMNRVTWAPGIPLRERWMREEERAMLDRVAGAWGFKDPLKRGEEAGAEWDALREFIGMRGMILDRAELLEGME